jgi:hypothetical protein
MIPSEFYCWRGASNRQCRKGVIVLIQLQGQKDVSQVLPEYIVFPCNICNIRG